MSERFTPSDLQAQAIREIKDWFLHRTAEQQVFRVFGYAGTGKTTITRHAIDELGLDTMAKDADGIVSGSDGVLYAAFTGKAALVMTRKGTPASHHPQPDLPRLRGDARGDRAGQAGDRRDQGQAADPRSGRPAVRGVAAAQPRDPARRHPQAALRVQRAVDGARRRADRARRGLDGRRRHGARPARLRQADPGAGRPRPAAADQGRGSVHAGAA